MQMTRVEEIIEKQRAFFESGATKEPGFRKGRLKKLWHAIKKNEESIFDAIRKDLGKHPSESYIGETAIVRREIEYALRHLGSWTRARRVRLPTALLPAKGYIQSEPYGVVLIIGPWNYPFQLMLCPLVNALAAGNCAILKPSPLAEATSRLLSNLVNETFSEEYVALVEGGAEAASRLLEYRFDYIFFTGGLSAGRRVMQAAAVHATPITLELGGKNPCIVHSDVHIRYAARRIAWGKFFNAGQTCIAPDYILVDGRIKHAIIEGILNSITEFYGRDPSTSPDYGRIINQSHFDRLNRLLKSTRGRLVAGGDMDETERYIGPAILDNISPDDPVMGEEIFGPLLPVMEYEDIDRALSLVKRMPAPITLYVFARDDGFQKKITKEIQSGSVCINDTLVHFSAASLPFGGIGESGMGRYHGKAGFDTFSHSRSVLKRYFVLDLTLRYPPYTEKKLGLLKRVL